MIESTLNQAHEARIGLDVCGEVQCRLLTFSGQAQNINLYFFLSVNLYCLLAHEP